MGRKKRYSLRDWQKNCNHNRLIQAQRDAAAAKQAGKKPKKHKKKPGSNYFNPHQTFYGARDALIRAAGFPDYATYLKSDLWKKIRQRVMDRDGSLCQICKNQGQAAHHRRYNASAILGTIIDNIVCLCHECHKAVEFTPEGNKRVDRYAIEDAYKKLEAKYAQRRMDVKRHQRQAAKLISDSPPEQPWDF